MFSSDINFDAFQAEVIAQAYTSRMTNSPSASTAEVSPRDLFAGIGNRVKEHRKAMEKQRMEQLYSTSSSNTSVSDWTKVFVNGKVDWKKYLSDQKSSGFMNEVRSSINSHRSASQKLLESTTVAEDSAVSDSSPSPIQHQQSLRNESESKVDDVIPLPNGKVVQINASARQSKYFYVS
jgi:hypothetical protein